MTEPPDRLAGLVFVGVDTHKDTHTYAVCDPDGQHLATRQFPTDGPSLTEATSWAADYGAVGLWAVECTGSYGLGLATLLAAAGAEVRDVPNPVAGLRDRPGKDDPSDALSAARQAAGAYKFGLTCSKVRTEAVQHLGWLLLLREQHVTSAKVAQTRLKAVIVTVPADLRDTLRGAATDALVRTCSQWRPAPAVAGTVVLRECAKRVCRDLAKIVLEENRTAGLLEKEITVLVQAICPALLDVTGIGPAGAAVILSETKYTGPGNVPTDSQLASFAGVAPIPVPSGQRDRHRLNRGGNRRVNAVLHRMVLSQARCDPTIKAWVEAKMSERGKTKKDALRASKRHAVRLVHQALLHPFPNADTAHRTRPPGRLKLVLSTPCAP